MNCKEVIVTADSILRWYFIKPTNAKMGTSCLLWDSNGSVTDIVFAFSSLYYNESGKLQGEGQIELLVDLSFVAVVLGRHIKDHFFKSTVQ